MISFVLTLTAWSGSVPAATVAADVVRASGIGHPPQGMRGERANLMARRAAEVVAVRNLARSIDPSGVQPVPPFRYVSSRTLADGSVQVEVEARIRKLAALSHAAPAANVVLESRVLTRTARHRR